MNKNCFWCQRNFRVRLGSQQKEQFSGWGQIDEHLSTRPVGETRVVHSICHHGNHTPSANHSPTASKLKKRESTSAIKPTEWPSAVSTRSRVYHDNVKVKLPAFPPPFIHFESYPQKINQDQRAAPPLQRAHSVRQPLSSACPRRRFYVFSYWILQSQLISSQILYTFNIFLCANR